jgi:hypothetical protein
MTSNDLRRKNARLREIGQVLGEHPELPDAKEEICLKHDLFVEIGALFLERTDGKLQERPRAMIERRPDLDRYFDI